MCPSPVSLENPYKWKISLQSTVQHTSPCVPPLSLWKILTNGKYPYNQPCNVLLRVSLPCPSGKSLQMENILTLNRAIYTSPCVPPLSLWKILTNGKYPYNQPCNVLLRVSLPCLSGKSLQMENILTLNRAIYLSVCPSPAAVSLENPYKWKISLQSTMQCISPCVPPLSVWKILTNGKYPYNQPCNVFLRVSLPCPSGKSLQMENFLTINRAMYFSVCPSPVRLENPYKWKISLQSTVQCTSPCVPPLSVWKILTNGKYPYNQPCNVLLRVSLPCPSGKSLQMENILTLNRAIYLSVCPSPVRLENPYKWKISLQSTVQCTSPCVPPLSVWKILTNGKYPYTKPCNIPLRVSLPCLSGKSLQMENILTINHAMYFSVCPSPVRLENPYKWKISLQSTVQCTSPCVPPLSVWKILTNGKYPYTKPCNIPLRVSLPCLSGKSLQMENILTLNRATYLSVCPSPVSLENPYKWKISLQSTVQCISPCVPPLSVWKILTNGKYPYNHNIPLCVSLPCLSGKSLQMENILTINRATYLSVCPSPVSLENPYKWKISLQPQYTSLCVPPLSLWKILTNGKYPYNQPCNIPLRVSLPCLSGKSLQMENILTTNRAT